MESYTERYERLCNEPSDINEHLPTLRAFAEQCDHVTEFGTRHGVSLSAFLMAQPADLVTYDIAESRLPELDTGDTRLQVWNGPAFDTTKMEAISRTDLLFIDTFHSAGQLAIELLEHSWRVQRLIVLHDTLTYWQAGENGTSGLLNGVLRWRQDSPVAGSLTDGDGRNWRLLAEWRNNNGLQVWERVTWNS